MASSTVDEVYGDSCQRSKLGDEQHQDSGEQYGFHNCVIVESCSGHRE